MNFPTHIVSTAGLILNEEEKVLMVKHPIRGWEIPGGIVEVGETLTDALKREIKEETGVEIEVDKLVTVHSNIGVGIQYDGVSSIPTIVSFGFTGKMVSGELATSDESLEVNWFYRNEVLDIIEEEFIRDKVRCMLNYDGRTAYGAFSHNPYTLHGVEYL